MPRQCYWIDPNQTDPEGFVPSLVTEREEGHQPLVGNGHLASPWRWGKTYDEARTICAKHNLEDFGLTEREAADIVASSMFLR